MKKTTLSFRNVNKSYASLKALNDISFSLAEGEILGLFGHNGAGKTTIMKLALGMIKPNQGEIDLFSTKNATQKEIQQHKHKIGYLPENVAFYDHLTARQILTFFARLKSIPLKDALELIETIGLNHAVDRPIKTYSKGMRQRLGLAQAFLGGPKLLLLDEPTVGLDPIATKDFYKSLEQLKSGGTSVILCSHVLPGVEEYIDRSMILNHGTKIASGTVTELREKAQLPVIINALGHNLSLSENPKLRPYLVNENTLSVPAEHKMFILNEVLQEKEVKDIEVNLASLARLYEYYSQETLS